MAKPIPEGMHTVTPSLIVDGAAEAISFYQRAFGAVELSRAVDPSGKKVWHAAIRIGDSTVFLSDPMPDMGVPGYQARLWLYFDGVDAAFTRAVEAGAKATMPVADQFWGDRMGMVADPWGNHWALAQHIKDLTPEELRRAQDEMVKQMAKSNKK